MTPGRAVALTILWTLAVLVTFAPFLVSWGRYVNGDPRTPPPIVLILTLVCVLALCGTAAGLLTIRIGPEDAGASDTDAPGGPAERR